MNYKNDHRYCVALKLFKGIGSVLYKNIIDKFGSAKNFFCTKNEQLNNIQKIGFNVFAVHAEKEVLLKAAERFLEIQKERGICLLAYGEEGYPSRLAQLHAPPSLLYYNSSTPLNAKRVVSIVGTRHATNYGKGVTKALVAQLKTYDALIVSGLAYGIDITAHRAAIAHDIPTIAVMPGGLDMIYPAEHIPTVKAMQDGGGGLISEYSLGIKPVQHQFPARNKIIAGIADATIVVEAAHKSGALITACYANEFNREVFAVPGSVHAPKSAGCHDLIKKHEAHLLTNIEEFAYIMNWDQKPRTLCTQPTTPSIPLTVNEKKIVALLTSSPQKMARIDTLKAHLNLPLEKITSLTLELELKQVIDVVGGGYILR